MEIKTSTIEISLGYEIEKENGEVEFIPNGEFETVITTDIYASEGMALRNIVSGFSASKHVTVGTMDSVENYEEIPENIII